MVDEKPRREIWNLIQGDRQTELLKEAGRFHGHYCPFLSLGVKAGSSIINELGLEHGGMEKVIAIVETNNCFSDGIQYSTGCTFGNNSLIYRDFGKTAVTIAQREEEEAIRVVVKPNVRGIWENEYPEYSELFEKVVKERSGDEQDGTKMMRLARKISFKMIEVDFQKLFKMKNTSAELPDYAPIFESVICSECGESVMITRTVEKGEEKLCIPCADENYHELDGNGISTRE